MDVGEGDLRARTMAPVEQLSAEMRDLSEQVGPPPTSCFPQTRFDEPDVQDEGPPPAPPPPQQPKPMPRTHLPPKAQAQAHPQPQETTQNGIVEPSAVEINFYVTDETDEDDDIAVQAEQDKQPTSSAPVQAPCLPPDRQPRPRLCLLRPCTLHSAADVQKQASPLATGTCHSCRRRCQLLTRLAYLLRGVG
ncbi:uncharacterized protein LOC144160883 [Haemaphysalis longicornis]